MLLLWPRLLLLLLLLLLLVVVVLHASFKGRHHVPPGHGRPPSTPTGQQGREVDLGQRLLLLLLLLQLLLLLLLLLTSVAVGKRTFKC